MASRSKSVWWRASWRRVLVLAMAVLMAATFAGGCEEEIDPTTDEGIKKALSSGEKLDEAMEELRRKKDDERAKFAGELESLYMDGSNYDDEVLKWLARLEDPELADAYNKAINSGDKDQILAAASAVSEMKLAAAGDSLANAFEATGDPEIRQAVLEAGTNIKNERLTKLAASLLSEKSPEDERIAVLRAACRMLAFQADPSTTRAALKGMFYVDQAGRSLGTDCSQAVLSIGQPAVPEVLTMFKGENEEINNHVARHQDIMTDESITLRGVGLLGKLQAKQATDLIVAELADPAPVSPPDVLATKPTGTPEGAKAWGEWGALIGQVTQELILALNDIGVEGHADAATTLGAIYAWQEPYPTKYKRATDIVNMVEISARVNAARVMVENGMVDEPEAMQTFLGALKNPDFDDALKLRPAARAAIVQDLVTYMAVASKPGWTQTAWKFFDEMAGNELSNAKNEEYKKTLRDKYGFDLEPARIRIADVKSTFELADECGDKGDACYAKVLQEKEPPRYRELKAIYELGKSGKAEHFDLILSRIGTVDQAMGYLYATTALLRLGDASKVEAVQKKIEELEATMDGQKFKFMKDTFEPLTLALAAKPAK